MSTIDPNDEELEVGEELIEPASKGRRSFSSVRRDLSEEELGSPAVQKLLLDELDRLDKEAVALQGYRDRFHDTDKRASVLQEKFKTYSAHEMLFNICLIAGSAMIGYAPSAWSNQPVASFVMAIGAVLVAGGLLAKREKL